MFYRTVSSESEITRRFEGRFWLLWEDEPVDPDSTRYFEFRDGVVFDARTMAPRGSYVVLQDGVDATLDERHGHREVVKLRMSDSLVEHDFGFTRVIPPFDEEADGYALTFTNVAYEEYAARRPANDHETDEEEDARRDWETDQFGLVPMFGYGYRDCEEVRELGERNQREYLARQRREAMSAVK